MMFIKKSKKIVSLIAIVVVSLQLVSCGENSDSNVDMQGEAGLMLIHSAPNTGDFRLFIDSTAVNNAIPYGVSTPYLVSKVGRRNAKLKLSPSDEVLIDQNTFLKAQNYYSFFIADINIHEQNSQRVYVAVTDNLVKPKKERIKLRFLNMVPDTLRVDLRTQFSTDTVSKVSFSNAAFKSVSVFQDLKAGTYSFEVVRTGTLTDTIVKTQSFTFEEGKIYTMWLGGLRNGQGNKSIKTYIINNN